MNNLGDKILHEYIKGHKQEDIVKKLNIDNEIYEKWKEINQESLDKVDEMLKKRELSSSLKITSIPNLLEDNKFLYKEPPNPLITSKNIQTMTLENRKQRLQDKLDKLNGLESQGKIGHNEYLQASKILNDEMENINKQLNT